MSDTLKKIVEQIVKIIVALICKKTGCCKDCSAK